MQPDFLSCDWGTTSFRLRWISGSDGRTIRELCEKTGVKTIYTAVEHEHSGPAGALERPKAFGRFLSEKLDGLLAGDKAPQTTMPLVISGMASSSIGWKELSYSGTPFPL